MLKYLVIFSTVIIFLHPAVGLTGGERYRESLGGSGPYEPFDYELPLLPSYCTCRLRGDDPRWRRKCYKWTDKFKAHGARGRDVVHIHHYCSGLLMLSRLNRGVGERSALLKKAEDQFRYMITHSSPNFILMPEIHLNMGITQKHMGKDGQAIKHFLQAIKLKKNYVPAYIQIIEFHKEHHDYRKAISVAKTGLKYSPNSKLLQHTLRELESLPMTERP